MRRRSSFSKAERNYCCRGQRQRRGFENCSHAGEKTGHCSYWMAFERAVCVDENILVRRDARLAELQNSLGSEFKKVRQVICRAELTAGSFGRDVTARVTHATSRCTSGASDSSPEQIGRRLAECQVHDAAVWRSQSRKIKRGDENGFVCGGVDSGDLRLQTPKIFSGLSSQGTGVDEKGLSITDEVSEVEIWARGAVVANDEIKSKYYPRDLLSPIFLNRRPHVIGCSHVGERVDDGPMSDGSNARPFFRRPELGVPRIGAICLFRSGFRM